MTTITLDVAELASGIRLPYAEAGRPDGTPVVLLHGLTDSWRSFEDVMPHLPASARALAVSQRGQGDASRPARYGLAELVADVAGFLDALGIEKAVIAGHSMGSIVATRFAVDHPERTAALVIMGGATSFTRLGLDEMVDELDAVTAEDWLDYLRGFQESTLARPVRDGLVDTAVSESAKVSIADCRALLCDTCLVDFSADLGRITAPTLIVWGEADVICPRGEQDGLLAAIPGARLIVFAGAGHALHWEEPERFAAVLAGFVAEVAS